MEKHITMAQNANNPASGECGVIADQTGDIRQAVFEVEVFSAVERRETALRQTLFQPAHYAR